MKHPPRGSAPVSVDLVHGLEGNAGLDGRPGCGGLSAVAGGYLGDHLSITRKDGRRDSRFVDLAPA